MRTFITKNKKILIIIGLLLLGLNFIICLIDIGNIFGALLIMTYQIFNKFGSLENVLFLLSILFICLGLIIKEDKTNKVINNNSITKYKLLRFLGYLPFIGMLCYTTYDELKHSFLYNKSYNFEALWNNIVFISIFLWPLYIVGIIIIITSSSKIRHLKKSKFQKSETFIHQKKYFGENRLKEICQQEQKQK